MYNCSEMFERCWWRNRFINCCDMFKVQKSEYGICHAFNSAASVIGKLRLVRLLLQKAPEI